MVNSFYTYTPNPVTKKIEPYYINFLNSLCDISEQKYSLSTLRTLLKRYLLVPAPWANNHKNLPVYLIYDNDQSFDIDSKNYHPFCINLNGSHLIEDQYEIITKLYPIEPTSSFVSKKVYEGSPVNSSIVSILHDHFLLSYNSELLNNYLYIGRSLATIHEAIIGHDTIMFGHYKIFLGAYTFKSIEDIALLLATKLYVLVKIEPELDIIHMDNEYIKTHIYNGEFYNNLSTNKNIILYRDTTQNITLDIQNKIITDFENKGEKNGVFNY
jgi:hypothetical protein